MSKLNPTKFPEDKEIPLTLDKLNKQNVKYCHNEILAQNQCLFQAKRKYIREGNSPNKGPDWSVYHMLECFDYQNAANKCVIKERDKELKERAQLIEDLEAGLIKPSDVQKKMRQQQQQVQQHQQQQQGQQEHKKNSKSTIIQQKEENLDGNLKKPWYRFGF